MNKDDIQAITDDHIRLAEVFKSHMPDIQEPQGYYYHNDDGEQCYTEDYEESIGE